MTRSPNLKRIWRCRYTLRYTFPCLMFALLFTFSFATEPLAAQESAGDASDASKIFLPVAMQKDADARTEKVYGTLYTEVAGYAQLEVRDTEGDVTVISVEDGGAGLWQYTQQEITLSGTWQQKDGVDVFVAQSGEVSAEIAANEAIAKAQAQIAQEAAQWAYAELSAAAVGGPNGQGKWSRKIDLPLIPVSLANLPNGKLLMWAAHEPNDYKRSTGKTVSAIFDPSNNGARAFTVSSTNHDMFCSGTTNLADGRILINGGSTNNKTTIYDGNADRWVSDANMNIKRGYNANVMLADGSVMTIGGSWSGGRQENKSAEVWRSNGGWSVLDGLPVTPIIDGATDPEGVYRSDNHAWLWTAKTGKVFHAGPSAKMHWLDTSGRGSYETVGDRQNDGYAMAGTTVMYEQGKLLKTGGSTSYAKRTAANNRAFIININRNPVKVQKVQDMIHPRTYHSTVVLPTGEVLALGGTSVASSFNDNFAIMEAEIWNPKTKKWRPVARMNVPRTYHSAAILMPNGKVFMGGGGLCGDCNVNHPDAEIYSPPYLFNADGSDATRPRIIAAPQVAANGGSVTVRTSQSIKSFALIRLSSVTHGTNNDQRRAKLKATQVGTNEYKLSIPKKKGNVPPGYYMLFAMNDQGTPSVAHTIKIGGAQPPASQPPTPQPPASQPSTPSGLSCQQISDTRGTHHNVTWGSATAAEQAWWIANGCATQPSSPQAPQPPAPQPPAPTSSTFSLKAKHSGKCVVGTNNVQQWACKNKDNHKWQTVNSDGGFMLKNVAADKCISVEGSSNDKGANIYLSACNGTPNQTLNWQGSTLQFKHSNKCLDVSGISSDNGANIHQWTCRGSDNQSFTQQ